jgi:hypothetical protein
VRLRPLPSVIRPIRRRARRAKWASPAVRALVNNINIQRKAAYTQQSAASGATVEQFAFTSGCNLILKTAPGEKYKGPDGVWKTRTAAPPERDSRCI